MEYKNIAKSVKFDKSAMFGYKHDDVNAFVIAVEKEIDDLNKELKDLRDKNEKLIKSNDEYHQEEESIREVILKAQKLAKVLIKDAKAKAERIVNEAVATSEEISSRAKNKAELLVNEIKTQALTDLALMKQEIGFEKNNLETIKSESSEFKSKLLVLYKEHLEMLNSLPSFSAEAQEAPENIDQSNTKDFFISSIEEEEVEPIVQNIEHSSSRRTKLEKEIEDIVHLESTADIEALLNDREENKLIGTKEIIDISTDKKPDNIDGTKVLNSTKTINLQFGRNSTTKK